MRRLLPIAALCLLLPGFAGTSAAQTGAAYVNDDKVSAALEKGGVLVDRPQVRVAGGHRAQAGALETQNGTTILFVTDGAGLFAAGAQSHPLAKGDLIVIPAGTAQWLPDLPEAIS